MVDVVASSTTEVLLGILEAMEKKYGKKLITEDVATLLLAGIITDTGSFQHANTSPRAMEASAKLLDLGARQQEIIKNIYKTKKLSTLKLWGMVLSKVQVDPLYRMVWSTITKEDLLEAGATSEETGDIIDDLLSNAPGAEVIMLIKYHEEGYVSVSMRSTTNSVDVGKISSEMGGGGHVRAAGYKVRDGKSFEQVVSEILEKVRKYQTDRLNIQIETKPVPQPTPQPVPQPEKRPEQSVPQPSTDRPAIVQQPAKETMLEFKAPKKKQLEPKPEQSVPQPSNNRPTTVPQPSIKPPKKKEPQKQVNKPSDKPAEKQAPKNPEQNK
jgi:hypothetical protein